MHSRRISSLFYLLLVIISPKLFALFEWHELGSDFKNVRNIIHHDTSRILVTTDEGIFLSDYLSIDPPEWRRVGVDLYEPVNDIIEYDSDRIIIAIGHGSSSDGVYFGEYISDQPPYYEFTLINQVTQPDFPQSIALDKKYDPILYVGAKNIISKNIEQPNGKFGEFSQIYSAHFGAAEPFCADIQWVFDQDFIFAGGYDLEQDDFRGDFIQIDQNSVKTSWHNLRVTSIAEMYDETGIHDIYIGTIDSGIYSFPQNNPNKIKNESEPSFLPLIDMAIGGNKQLEALFNDDNLLYVIDTMHLYARTSSGWENLTDFWPMPKPKSLAIAPGYCNWSYGLLFGTENEVFLAYNTAEKKNFKPDTHYFSYITVNELSSNNYSILFSTQKEGIVSIRLFNLAGKVVASLYNNFVPSGNHRLVWDGKSNQGRKITCGTYLIQLRSNTSVFSQKVVFIK